MLTWEASSLGMLHDINNPLNQILTSHESLFSEISALETAPLVEYG